MTSKVLTSICVLLVCVCFCTNLYAKGLPFNIDSGKVNAPIIRYRGFVATNVIGEVSTKDKKDLLLRNVTGDFYEGKIRGNFRILKGDTSFRLFSERAKLEKVPPKLLGGKKFSGLLDGEMTFSFNRDKDGNVQRGGHGAFNISNGDLGPLPLIASLQDVLDLPLRKERRIHSLRADFSFKNDGIHFKHLDLKGNDIAFFGKGLIRYNGDISFSFKTKAESQLIKLIPIGGPILAWITKGAGSLIPVYVRGNIKDPQVKIGAK